MPFTIYLDNPLPAYSGGETIRGRVALECISPIEVRDIRISLSGKAKTKIRKVKHSGAPRTTYRGEALLFEKEKILLHVDGILPPQTLEWTFEFTFPTYVQPRSSKSQWPQKIPFASDITHLLPPTFTSNVKNELWEIGCLVSYQIQAEVSKMQRMLVGKSQLFHEVLPLTFIPPALPEEKTDILASRKKDFTIKSLLLLPENRGRKLDVREKMTSWLSPSQLPRFKFQITFTYSCHLHQSEPIICTLEIQPLMEDSTVTWVPPVFLESVSLTLVTRTAARSSPSLMGALSGDVEESQNVLLKRSLRVPFTDQINIGELFGQISLQHPDPSFCTFNICRSYKLCANFVLECAEKRVSLSLSELDIHIYPDKKDSEVSDTLTSGKAKELSPGRQFTTVTEQLTGLDGHGVSPPAYESSSTVSVVSCEKEAL